MTQVDPKLIIRLGSHAEKDYLEKTARLIDGVIVAANLVEATPGATASLLNKYGGKKYGTVYYIDPMTYGYAQDLDLLKSERKVKKKPVFDFKRSYRGLSEQFGGMLAQVVKKDKRLTRRDLTTDSAVETLCESVANYQMNRIGGEFAKDPEYASFAASISRPAAILTPYFYAGGRNAMRWLELVPRLARATAALDLEIPVHAVVFADEQLLYDDEAMELLKTDLPGTGVEGVWLWFSSLNEHVAEVEQLVALRDLASDLANTMQVNTMHGGYYSLALSRIGLSGLSHGIGYGEQKDVAPVQGQSTPTVRYYLPNVKKRLGVPQIERTFRNIGVTNVAEFHKQICDCVVCKGVVRSSLREFSAFGDLHYSSPSSQRKSQTPAAAKRCRFHFMLNRIRERDKVRQQSIEDIVAELEEAARKWCRQPSIANDADHLHRWREALED